MKVTANVQYGLDLFHGQQQIFVTVCTAEPIDTSIAFGIEH
jgi:hypothetical protein